MSEERRYFRVGLFVLVGSALFVGMILLLGGASFLEEPVEFETYLDESVQGLEVGSPVRYRGVQLGSVTRIGLVRDKYQFDTNKTDVTYGGLVLVEMKLVPPIDRDEDEAVLEANLKDRVQRGLRLRLATQGITGVAYLEADFMNPADYPPMKITWTPENLYVPSAPSTLKGLTTAVERIFQRLEGMNIEQVVTHFDELLVTTHNTIAELEAHSVTEEASGLLADLRATNGDIQAALGELRLGELSTRARLTLAQLERAIVDVQLLVEDSRYDLGVALENLRVVSEDLRDVTSTAKAYPSYLLLGQPPKQAQAVSAK